jgi:hypothetical protein
MARIKKFSNTDIRINADDHNPPHFHILGPGFQVAVDLATMEISAGKARSKDIREAMEWAMENVDFLKSEWKRLTAR